MPPTIITHTDSAGYCSGVAAFEITRRPDGDYDTLMYHGDRSMCGFQVKRTEFKQLSSEKLGVAVGNHLAYSVFAAGPIVTRQWVARACATIATLRDPTLNTAVDSVFKLQSTDARKV